MKHTREPWSLTTHDPIRVKGGTRVRAEGPHRGQRIIGLTETDFDHAKACVNACEGIEPTAVPFLLEACELSCRCLNGNWEHQDEFQGMCRDDAIEKLRAMMSAAIAKAKGGAS